MNCGRKIGKSFYFTPEEIRTRNRPVRRQMIYPLDYHLVFWNVHSILTTLNYIFVSLKKKLRFKNVFVIRKYLYKQNYK